MKRIPLFLASLLALIVASCSGSSDSFRVVGTIEGAPTQALRMIYYDGSGMQNTEVRTDEDGSFETEGSAPTPVAVELRLDDDFTTPPLAFFVVANGEKVKIKGSAQTKGYDAEVRGSKHNELLSAFLKNCGQLLGKAMNDSIAAFVSRNSESLAATALVTRFFDNNLDLGLADSLFHMIATEARPLSLIEGYAELLAMVTGSPSNLPPMSFYGSNDSLLSYVPSTTSYGVLAFTEARTPDSIRRFLRDVRAQYPKRRMKVVQVCLWADSVAWRRSIVRDSATWQQGWMPGGASATTMRRIHLTDVPTIFVVDSTSNPIYRGSSVSQARAALTARGL